MPGIKPKNPARMLSAILTKGTRGAKTPSPQRKLKNATRLRVASARKPKAAKKY